MNDSTTFIYLGMSFIKNKNPEKFGESASKSLEFATSFFTSSRWISRRAVSKGKYIAEVPIIQELSSQGTNGSLTYLNISMSQLLSAYVFCLFF